MSRMDAFPLDAAILKTVLYTDRFDFPLTPEEIHRQLISDSAVPPDAVRRRLEDSPWLRERLEERGGYYFLRGRKDLVELRLARREKSRRLLRRVEKFLRRMAALPFIEGIFLSGGNAFESPADDDVDLFLVCRPGACWLSLFCARLLAALTGARPLVCANYIVDSEHLRIPEETFFTAYQLVHLRPLHGAPVLERMRRANRWTERFLPNAPELRPDAPTPPDGGPRPWPQALTKSLDGLVHIFYRPYLLWRAGLRHSPPGVILSKERLKLHILDHSLLHGKHAEPEPAPMESAAACSEA